jgi:hypothetical protein
MNMDTEKKYTVEYKSLKTGETGRWDAEMTRAEADEACDTANRRFAGWLEHTVVKVES